MVTSPISSVDGAVAGGGPGSRPDACAGRFGGRPALVASLVSTSTPGVTILARKNLVPAGSALDVTCTRDHPLAVATGAVAAVGISVYVTPSGDAENVSTEE